MREREKESACYKNNIAEEKTINNQETHIRQFMTI